jgi:hypothetical protein
MSWRRRRWTITARAAAIALSLLIGSACGIFKEESGTPRPELNTNIVVNGGFEDGNAPWIAAIGASSDAASHGGNRSLALSIEPGGATDAAGAVQFTIATEFPEYFSGYYLAPDWPDEGGPYLEVAVAPQKTDVYTPSLRFIIAGADREPAAEPDSQVIMVSRSDPTPGEWTYFSYPVQQAYLDRTGSAPGAWGEIGFRVQLRYATPEGMEAGATVYLDDLYLGSQEGNPNRPPD